ncbi:hypothetical protein H6P81_017624 [Aristolochia fimbriata]|uniref:Uncharacterized protein n=1 Tax=Aristolochia fimbriata TaxID=158543 RepID=A0AAV7DYU8_ARIFI|nr:hypothetical protein H6P81_017624 [Aristolochia fimbriata]
MRIPHRRMRMRQSGSITEINGSCTIRDEGRSKFYKKGKGFALSGKIFKSDEEEQFNGSTDLLETRKRQKGVLGSEFPERNHVLGSDSIKN